MQIKDTARLLKHAGINGLGFHRQLNEFLKWAQKEYDFTVEFPGIPTVDELVLEFFGIVEEQAQ